MESGQIAARNDRGVSDAEWDSWMSFILDEFLVKGCGHYATLEKLQQRNHNVTDKQFRDKLELWGFYKKLKKKEWQYVHGRIQKRASKGKDSAVILSGIRFSREYVKKQINRHKDVTLANKLHPPPSPEPPDEDMPLYICTPRATSPAIVSRREYEYSRSLPWIQFNEYLLPYLMSGLRLTPPDEPETAITVSNSQRKRPRKRCPANSSRAWTAFQNLARRSMEIVLGSSELSQLLFINRSVDRVADYFDGMLPPTYPGENLRRAIALSGGARYEMQKEVVKVLMFLASNHLIMDRVGIFHNDDAEAIVDVFHFSGLSQPGMLSNIVRLSRESLTLTSLVDLLYEAAVNTEAVDIVTELLAADDRIDINRPVGKNCWSLYMMDYTLSALEYALTRGSLVLAHQMITMGADVNRRPKSCDYFSPLSLAILPETNLSIQLVGLLLKSGAGMNDQASEALYAAVSKGSIELIDILHQAGADFASIRLIIEEKTQDLEALMDDEWMHHPCFRYSWALNTYNCLGLAASYASSTTPHNKCEKHGREAHGERTALELVKHILKICGAGFDIDNRLKSDAMIFAALRGYTDVISFLYEKGARLDARNGFLCPIYAAVSEGHVECCQLLLDLGGSAQPSYRSLGHDPIEFYSPLHVAVEHDSRELVDLLLQSGADANSPCVQCIVTSRDRCLGFVRQGYSTYDSPITVDVKILSPLGLALEVGSWEVASFLLDKGATSTDGSINRAVEDGQSQLVDRLLKLRADSDKTTCEYRDALEISICEGHELIALDLIQSGVPVTNSTLSHALQHDRIRIAVKIIDTGIQLTGPELVGLFRVPSLPTIQSLLQYTSPDTIIGERSSDGRSFLENAILSGDIAVVKFALSLDPLYYDSGALCAITLAAVLPTASPDINNTLGEILQRRKFRNQPDPFWNEALESTAILIATYHERVDIITQMERSWECTTEVKLERGYLSPKLNFLCAKTSIRQYQWEYQHRSNLLAYKPWDGWHGPHDYDAFLVSPLLIASEAECEPAVEELLVLGYKPDALSLNAAIQHCLSPYLIRILAQECTDINATDTSEAWASPPPLLVAAVTGDLDSVRVLIDMKVDPNAGDHDTRNDMLIYLIHNRRFDILDILLESGLDIIYTAPFRSYSTLGYAAVLGYLDMMRYLLDRGVDSNAHRASVDGVTALEVAAGAGRLDAVQLLLESGALTTGRGQIQYISAVHRATKMGYSAVVELLKSHRQWTTTDWHILRWLEGQDETLIYVYHDQCTREYVTEFLKVKSWAETVVTLCPYATIQIMKAHNKYSNMAEIIETVVSLETGSTIMTVKNRSLADCCQNWLLIPDSPQNAADVPIHLSQYQIGLPDATSVSDVQSEEDIESYSTVSDTDLCFENTDHSLADIHLGVHDERVLDEERQLILDDMLGVREALIEPIEWSR